MNSRVAGPTVRGNSVRRGLLSNEAENEILGPPAERAIDSGFTVCNGCLPKEKHCDDIQRSGQKQEDSKSEETVGVRKADRDDMKAGSVMVRSGASESCSRSSEINIPICIKEGEYS
jgi:hypothetical protein